MVSQIISLTIVYSTVRSKKTSKHRVTDLCEGNSQVTSEFFAKRASNAEMPLFDDDIFVTEMVSNIIEHLENKNI